MLRDPCSAELVPGLFPSSQGYLARLKATIPDNSDGVSGFILWCPKYHNGESYRTVDNEITFDVFIWSAVNGSVTPNASDVGRALSFSESLLTGDIGRFADPAGALIGSDNAIVMDARTLSACIRLTYTGRMDRASGQVAFIENLPLASLVGSPEQKDPPPSVDQLFSMAAKVQRLGVDTLEAVYRPDADAAHTFHDAGDGCVHLSTVEGSRAFIGESARITEPTCFGFAWKGLDNGGSAQLSFAMVKNVEWRPSPISGFAAVTPKQQSTKGHISRALVALDRAQPSWTTKLINSTETLAGTLAKAAFTGVGNGLLALL